MSAVESDHTRGVIDTVLSALRETVLVLDGEQCVLAASASLAEALRFDVAEARGVSIFEIGGGTFEIPAMRALLEGELAARDTVRDVEIIHRFETLGRRTFRVHVRRDAAQNIVVLAIEGLTDAGSTGYGQAAPRERFQLFAENVREYALIGMDESTRITLWNPGAERILGWTEGEALGQQGEIIFTPEDRAVGIPRREAEIARTDGQALDERWQMRRDGSRFWASGVMVALKEGDRPHGFAKILRDVTRRKQAETELEESHRWLRRILEVTPDVVALYDLMEDRLGFVSPHLISTLGYAQEEFYTLDRTAIGRILHPEDRARGAEVRRILLEDGDHEPYEISLRIFDVDGKERWYQARVVPFRREPSGRVREVLAVARDFTEIHDTQEELKRLTETLERRVEERTAQVRTLASTLTIAEQQERRRISQILHDDVQQRLYGIQMKMASVRRAAEAAALEKLVSDAKDVEQWLRDAIDMTRDLTVSLSPPVLKGEGLVDALQWLVVQMERMHRLRVSLNAPHSFFIPDEDVRVLLFQIVRELLFNVVKHAGVEEATVTIAEEADFLLISVLDAGKGFRDDPADHPIGDGAGFGLYSVRERLQLFGGGIDVRTAPGKGTRVEVRVPLSMVS